MSHFANVEEARKHRNVYLMVFAALAGLTVVTVGVAYVGLENRWPIPLVIAVALLVASIKGSLVAAYFMHLMTERGVIYWILALCALFFFVLMFVPVFTDTDNAMIKALHIQLGSGAH